MHYRAKDLEVSSEQRQRIDNLRTAFSRIYDSIDENCKNGKETFLAINRLEEAQMWAIKGISRE